ncbi:MAG: serine/threonine protein kinase [Lachnospira sp.]|nr:serine/threonine protein kinase [Lachnospira sp.]
MKQSTILFNKYEVISKLGHGASSVIFLVRNIKLNVNRAIKRIDKSHHLYSRFVAEAQILKSLNYPNIPIIYDIEEDDQYLYIIEEYIEGISLTSYITNHKNIPLITIYEYAKQICNTLLYMHQIKPIGILHLDLKPDNIIIADGIIKLIDYGNAVMVNSKISTCIGSCGFAAPEQYEEGVLTVAADIYSIGAILLYMATSTFDKNNILKVSSIELQFIISKCMKTNPKERYENISSLLKDLENINYKTNLSLYINVLGTKGGIGCTHVSIMLASYFKRKGYKCIYEEKNKNRNIIKMIRALGLGKFKNGFYQIEDCKMMPFSDNVIANEWKDFYDIIVRDYGCYEEMSIPVLEGITILVGGGKEYEIEDTIELYKGLTENNTTLALLNFMDMTDFVRMCIKRKIQNFYCMPIANNPFKRSRKVDNSFEYMCRNHFLKEKLHEKKRRNKNYRSNGD